MTLNLNPRKYAFTCPQCRNMIMTGSEKCRFCGIPIDPKLSEAIENEARLGEKVEEAIEEGANVHLSASRCMKWYLLMLPVLVGLVLSVGSKTGSYWQGFAYTAFYHVIFGPFVFKSISRLNDWESSYGDISDPKMKEVKDDLQFVLLILYCIAYASVAVVFLLPWMSIGFPKAMFVCPGVVALYIGYLLIEKSMERRRKARTANE